MDDESESEGDGGGEDHSNQSNGEEKDREGGEEIFMYLASIFVCFRSCIWCTVVLPRLCSFVGLTFLNPFPATISC